MRDFPNSGPSTLGPSERPPSVTDAADALEVDFDAAGPSRRWIRKNDVWRESVEDSTRVDGHVAVVQDDRKEVHSSGRRPPDPFANLGVLAAMTGTFKLLGRLALRNATAEVRALLVHR